MAGSYWFIDPSLMTSGQLCWAFVSYGYVISQACNLISDGSELLLLIPQLAGLVGCVVLPVLGAVPDGMIVLFSGLDPDKEVAQETLAVGIGSQAGSTIMLLTIPWFCAAWAGRVDLKDDGSCNYKPSRGAPRLTKPMSLIRTGVQPSSQIKTNAKIMFVTSLTYFAIQIPALYVDRQRPDDINLYDIKVQSRHESQFVLLGLVMCVSWFLIYLYIQYTVSRPVKDKPEGEGADPDSPKGGSMKDLRSMASMQIVNRSAELVDGYGLALFIDQFRQAHNLTHENASMNTRLLQNIQITAYLKGVLQRFFLKYKTTQKGIDIRGFEKLLKDINLDCGEKEAKRRFDEADRAGDGNGFIDINEFFEAFKALAATPKSSFTPASVVAKVPTAFGGAGEASGDEDDEDEDEDEDEEMPEDFKDLPEAEQRRRILMRSFWMMGVGTTLVVIFSDPMVDILSEIGKQSGVPTFYVSFVLAPLAANASEFVASYNYGAKKTSSSISISLSTLLGAAVMNNTYVLGIFFGLIYFQGLAWQFTAETITIFFVEAAVFAIVMLRTTIRTIDTCMVLCLYPLSLGIVYWLEKYAGFD